ncbi:hypothetical protein K402DRAFT_406642 [Aulographum hederae CBS 113979]|uniref:Chitin-binding type-4 domain-containing protein n=1 Tax=Aulographum hederae CBS 113979 TaxID=1176131 RepID=A0A6G1GS74_9PEZI|nr:hypothetical protein K402DRAFT_406642 [Aulographum hederae CBS 113979]
MLLSTTGSSFAYQNAITDLTLNVKPGEQQTRSPSTLWAAYLQVHQLQLDSITMRYSALIALVATNIGLVAGHGHIVLPPSRTPGPAMKAACGEQVFNNQQSDIDGNVETLANIAKNQKDYNPAACNLIICKGFQFDDNKANTQTFSAGQTVPIEIVIKAPHSGNANVSVVDLETNTVIGQPLKSFTDYASNAHPIPDSDKNFDIQMPDLGTQCMQPGKCAVQWYWQSPSADQTYESCVDFTMNGGDAPPDDTAATSTFVPPPNDMITSESTLTWTRTVILNPSGHPTTSTAIMTTTQVVASATTSAPPKDGFIDNEESGSQSTPLPSFFAVLQLWMMVGFGAALYRHLYLVLPEL